MLLGGHAVMSEKVIGVVGAGRMGLPMAKNLLEAGFEVIVADPNPDARTKAREAGAIEAESLASLGNRADIVLITVPTDDDVQEVCSGDDGLLAEMEEGTLVINSSTRPDLAGIIQEEINGSVSVIDAPMCRGEAAAKRGEILFLVGGDESIVSNCETVFDTCGEYTRLGDVGAGQVGKTANNLLMWISVLGDYEVLRLAEGLGVDPLALRDVLTKSSGDNWVLRRGHLENMNLTWPEKDLAIAMDLADEAAKPIPMTGLVSQLMKDLEVSDLEDYYFQGEDRIIN